MGTEIDRSIYSEPALGHHSLNTPSHKLQQNRTNAFNVCKTTHQIYVMPGPFGKTYALSCITTGTWIWKVNMWLYFEEYQYTATCHLCSQPFHRNISFLLQYFQRKMVRYTQFCVDFIFKRVLVDFHPPLCCTKAMKWAGHQLIATKRNCQNGIKSGKRATCWLSITFNSQPINRMYSFILLKFEKYLESSNHNMPFFIVLQLSQSEIALFTKKWISDPVIMNQ